MAVIKGSVTNVSPTQANVTGKFTISSGGSAYNNALVLKITVNGQSTTDTQNLKAGNYVQLSKTVAVERGTSAKTITIKGYSRTGTSLGTIDISTTVTVAARPYYTVKYNANGGSNAPSSQGKYHGYSLTITSKQPTRTGYTFKGWGTSSSATSVAYHSGGTYSKNESDTLYAIWTPKSIALNFYSNGGTFSGTTSSYKTNANYATTFQFSKVSTPTRQGYSFLGWASSSTSSTPTYYSISSMKINQTAAYNMYAVWQPNMYTYTFNANDGHFVTNEASKSVSRAYDDIINLSTWDMQVGKENYEFLGWSLTKLNPLGFGELPTVDYILPAETIIVDSINNPTYYAVWRLAWKVPSITYNEENNFNLVDDNNFEAMRCTNSSIAYYDSSTQEARRISDLVLDDEGKCAYLGFILKVNQEDSTLKSINVNIPSQGGSIAVDYTWSITSTLPLLETGLPGILLPDDEHGNSTAVEPEGACFMYITKVDEDTYGFEVVINNNYNVELISKGNLIILDCIKGVADIPIAELNLDLTIPSSLFIVDISGDGKNLALGKVANKTASPLYDKAFETQWPVYAYDKFYTSGLNNGLQFNYSDDNPAAIQIFMSADGHFTIIKV